MNKRMKNLAFTIIVFALASVGATSSMASERADTVPQERKENNWHFSLGMIGFYIADAGDQTTRSGSKEYDVDGSLSGYRISFGKGKERISISVYDGKYEFQSDKTYSSENQLKTKVESDRQDLDIAWVHILDQDSTGVIGFFLGVKRLKSEKNIYYYEYDKLSDSRDEKTFTGDTKWIMGMLGVLGSYRLSDDYPISIFGSFNFGLGAVSGIKAHEKDITVDGEIRTTFEDGEDSAYGINGTLGLQYLLFDCVAIQTGYRGQIMNSTDGFMKSGTYYDGHQSLFVALDILF